MPIRGLKEADYDNLNEMLEQAFGGAANDHRFIRKICIEMGEKLWKNRKSFLRIKKLY